jgi:hypothetical protein
VEELAARTAPLPDQSERVARLRDVIAGHSGRGVGLHEQDQPQRPVRNLEDPPWGHPMLAEEDLKRHPLTAFEVPPSGPQYGVEALPAGRRQCSEEDLPAGRPQRGEEGIFRPGPSIGQRQEMGAGSLSFCCGNASTYDRDRGDVLPGEHREMPDWQLVGSSTSHPVPIPASSASGLHHEMGVEGGGCGGRDLVDRTPGTQMFRPAHQNEMRGGEGRPDRSDQLGQPEPLRPSIVRASPAGRDDVRTSPAGISDVPARPTSRNDQGIVNAFGLTSRNCPGGQNAIPPEQSYNARNRNRNRYSAGVQYFETESTQHHGCSPIAGPAGVQHLVSDVGQHQNGNSNPVPFADPAGVQHLVSDFSQHQNERYGNPVPFIDTAGVQHLVSDFSQRHERYGNPAPSTDLAGVQHLVTNTFSEVTGLRGREAIAESRPSHRAGRPGMRGSGAIAGRSGTRGASPGGEPLGPSPSRRVGNPVWRGSFTVSVAQSHGSGAIAESGACVSGPFPGSIASPEHHERYDNPGPYDVRGNGWPLPY